MLRPIGMGLAKGWSKIGRQPVFVFIDNSGQKHIPPEVLNSYDFYELKKIDCKMNIHIR